MKQVTRMAPFPTDAQMDGGGLMLPPAVMALSGGMDSTCLLLRLWLKDMPSQHSASIMVSGIDGNSNSLSATSSCFRSMGHAVTYNLIDLRSAMSPLIHP